MVLHGATEERGEGWGVPHQTSGGQDEGNGGGCGLWLMQCAYEGWCGLRRGRRLGWHTACGCGLGLW